VLRPYRSAAPAIASHAISSASAPAHDGVELELLEAGQRELDLGLELTDTARKGAGGWPLPDHQRFSRNAAARPCSIWATTSAARCSLRPATRTCASGGERHGGGPCRSRLPGP
jgi:hypothetical protein